MIHNEITSHARIVMLALLGAATGAIGLSFYSLPFLSRAIAAETGWGTTKITLSASFFVFGQIVAAPIAGRLCDRFGARPVILISILLFAANFVYFACIADSLPEFYAGYFALGVTGSGTAYTIYGRIVTSWFVHQRGLALGIMMSGPGLAAAVLPLLLPVVIGAYGWRVGYLALALLALSAWPLAIVFAREQRCAEPIDEPAAGVARGMSLREALTHRRFWTMGIGVFAISTAIIGTQINLIGLLSATHQSEAIIRGGLATYGVSLIVGRIISGYLLDRIFAPYLAAVTFLALASVFPFFLSPDPWLLLPAVAVLGIASGTEGDACGYLISRYFGLKAYSEIFGWIFSFLSLGLAVGAAISGFLEQSTGGFGAWLALCSCLALTAALMFGTLGRYPSEYAS